MKERTIENQVGPGYSFSGGRLSPVDRNGFSLIELLAAIAITGLLAAASIPSYRSYVLRTYVVEALQLVEGAKVQIDYLYNSTGQLPCCQCGGVITGLCGCPCSSWTPPSTSLGPKDIAYPTSHVSLLRWFTAFGTVGSYTGALGRFEIYFDARTVPRELSGDDTGGGRGSQYIQVYVDTTQLANDTAGGSARGSLDWICGPTNQSMLQYMPSTCQTYPIPW